jgi:hypothetical protein
MNECVAVTENLNVLSVIMNCKHFHISHFVQDVVTSAQTVEIGGRFNS